MMPRYEFPEMEVRYIATSFGIVETENEKNSSKR